MVFYVLSTTPSRLVQLDVPIPTQLTIGKADEELPAAQAICAASFSRSPAVGRHQKDLAQNQSEPMIGSDGSRRGKGQLYKRMRDYPAWGTQE